MTHTEITKAIDSGNYEIKLTSDCGCQFSWGIDRQGRFNDDDSISDCCWIGNVLTINDDLIAEYVAGSGFKWLVDMGGVEDLDKIEEKLSDEMYISDDEITGEAHESKRKESLVDGLKDLISDGARLYRDNERGFANEYTVILVMPGAKLEDENIEDWDELEREVWADEYLYSGDAATQAFNGCRVIE